MDIGRLLVRRRCAGGSGPGMGVGRAGGQQPVIPATLACILTNTGMAALAMTIHLSTPIVVLMLGYTLLGLGNGLVNPPITHAAVTSLPAQ